MLYLFILLLIVVLGVVADLWLVVSKRDRILVSSVTVGVVLVWTAFNVVNIVGVGNVGIVYSFGNIVGQTGSGAVLVDPWQSVTSASIQTRAQSFTLDCFSKETQDVTVDATLNYRIAPKDIQRLYRTIGSNWFNIIVPTRINQVFKDETVKYLAVDIAPNRNEIRNDVLAEITKVLAPYSIQVEGLNIDDITFAAAFTNAIEDKQIATQQAEAAQNRVKTAKAEAAQIVALAKGQAEANTLQHQTLTPLVVENNAINKLNPNVKVIITNSSTILPVLSQILSGSTSSDPPPAAATTPTKK
jgi:prohibitin 1